MKRKFRSMWRVVIAMVLVAGLSLVVAAPVPAASPADTDVGFQFGVGDASDTAEWSTAKAGETDAMGSYSVELYENGTAPSNDYVQLIPPSGTTLSDLEALTNAWSFWYYFVDADNQAGPQLELKFTSGTDFIDITIMAAQHPHIITNEWTEVVLADDLEAVGYWSDSPALDESGEGLSLEAALTQLQTEGNWEDGMLDWELTRVQVQLWEADPPRTCYIDDITIDGTLYELEPIFLDAEYYSVGDTVEVTVPNFVANTDPIRVNPVTGEGEEATPNPDWEVSVISTSDLLGTTVALEETGADTGVFTASFTTVDTLPAAEDELYVQDGDTITVTYNTLVGWGAAAVSSTPLTAKVDDTAPTITGLTPADDAMTVETAPTISATYSDDTSGIDETSVEMLVDDVDVTADATVTGSGVTYTPEDDLAEGSHDVTVNVEDNAGNAATKSWSFRIVSWLAGPESATNEDLDALDTVGVAVSITGDTSTVITVGRYASNPEPDAALTFSLIENGFFDVQVTGTDTATLIVIKFADPEITAESTAYVWGETEGAWLECSDQGYNSVDEYLWVKVRDDTTPSIAELTGTPFGISGVPPVDILAYYRGLGEDPNVVETTDLLLAANDWANEVVPSGFTEPISTTQLLALANEWAATD